MLTATELRERLQYDPNTGRWIWLKSTRSGWVGRPAGSLDAKGYWCIKIDGQSYKASRLAYLYMIGEWPEGEMDHIDRQSWNDCWTNLRPATRSENNLNRVLIGTSGHYGIRKHNYNDSWVVEIKRVYVGSYKTLDEAIVARDEFVRQHERNIA